MTDTAIHFRPLSKIHKQLYKMKHMSLKTIIGVAIIIGPWSMVYSQTLSPKTTPACGGYFSAGGKSLSWTMGETVNTTVINGTKMLTQGNQQPYIFLKLLNLKMFIEGFYIGGGQMQAVLYTLNLNVNPAACDSITVEL